MPYPTTPYTRATDFDVPQADLADVAEQSHDIDLDSVVEDYPWVRRDEVLTIGGHRYFV